METRTLNRQQPVATVVAPLRTIGQPAFVQPEGREARVVGVVDDEHGSKPRQKWYGYGLQSGSRFSRNELRPSCASSDA